MRHDRELLALGHIDAIDIVDILDEMDAALELAHGALDFGMALVPDHDELVAVARQLGDLDVDPW